MIAEPAIFTCSICGEPSTDICAYCTKDACANHRCTRCKRCSDCCECEIPLSAAEAPAEPEAPVAEAAIPEAALPETDIELPADLPAIHETIRSEESILETESIIDDPPHPVEPPPDSDKPF